MKRTYRMKCLSFFVIISILLGVPVYAEPEPALAEETEDYIEIRTIEDLYAINTNMGGYYRLMNDIDMTEATAPGGDWDSGGMGWRPIGLDGSFNTTVFTGVFDGNGYTIKGMRMEITSGSSSVGWGLFSRSDGTIENLTLRDVSIICKHNRPSYLGAICGNNEGVIKYCLCTGSITWSPSSSGTCKLGGICGHSTGSIVRCINKSDISIIIDKAHHCDDSNIGGVCGYNEGEVDCCANTGRVNSDGGYCSGGGYYCLGGVCGRNYNSTSKIQCSYNIGDVKYTKLNTSGYDAWIGGISGRNGTILNCYNCGNITATGNTSSSTRIGGISLDGTISQSYNKGNTNGVAIGNSNISGCYYLNGTGTDNNNSTALTDAQMQLQSSFLGFDFENIWFIDPMTAYPYPQLRDNPQDTQKLVEEISISSYPQRVSYYIGETVDVTGGVLTVYYIDGTWELMPMKASMVSAEAFTETGMQTVTVSYLGATCTFDVNVSERPGVVLVEIVSPPDRTEFVRGTAFDFTGCVARITYDNGTSRDVDVSADMTEGGNINKLGVQTITYTYEDHPASFSVTVVGLRLEEIELVTLPDKLEYIEGQSLDLTGMRVTGHFNSGEIREITDYSISGFESVPGEHMVVVSYMGCTQSFAVSVRSKTVVSLNVSSAPIKTSYIQGEAFDPRGMVVKAVYDNGDIEVITDYSVGEMPSETGTHRLPISYEGVSTYVIIQITARELVSIEIVSPPDKKTYVEEEPFEPQGLLVAAVYDNGSRVEVTDYILSEADTLTLGTHELTVYYKGKTAALSYTVIAKTLDGIEVTLPYKTEYIVGEALDLEGMRVFAYYNNGKSNEVFDYSTSGYTGEVGSNNITVGYQGKTFQFPVMVYAPAEDWTVITEADCTTAGRKVLYSADGSRILQEAEIPPVGHREVTDAGYDATCTESGQTEGRHCSICGIVTMEQTVIPARGHLPENQWVVIKEATCTEGAERGKYCKNCGELLEIEHDAAPGHRPEVIAGTEATCDRSGMTESQKCEVCGITLVAAQTIPPTGHRWTFDSITKAASCTAQGIQTYRCTACGNQKTEAIPALGHSFESRWTVDIEPTCTVPGSKSHHCERCDAVSEVTEIKATGHLFSNYVSNHDATCTVDGTKTAQCAYCTETRTIPDLGTAGHRAFLDDALAPTCTKSGLTQGSHCSVCGTVLTKQQTVPALGHDYVSMKTEPTCTEKGYTTHLCTQCGDMYNDQYVLPKGHSVVVDKAKAATCMGNGLTEGTHCAVCHTILKAQTVVPPNGHTAGKPVKENEVAATYSMAGSYEEVVYCVVCKAEVSRIKKTVEKLARIEMSGLKAELEGSSYVYDGKAKTPQVTVKEGTYVLKQGTDYSIAYNNNVNAGTALVVITGKNAYTGTTEMAFTISKATQNISVETGKSVSVGKTVVLSVKGARGTVSFTSSNPVVAVVDKATGKVTAKKAGTVIITATAAETANYKTGTAKATLTVTAEKKFPFRDVVKTDACYEAVAWAYFGGIVKGKSTDIYAPEDNLTRGEFCTMLWRMWGKQTVKQADIDALPFADAKKSNHKSGIAWCYKQGIINGYGDGTFKPSRTLSRSNIIVMLFKLAKQEKSYRKPTIKNPYTDVKDNNKNISAYIWAYENKLQTDKKLRSSEACTRAEMVIFLYGYNNAYHVMD